MNPIDRWGQIVCAMLFAPLLTLNTPTLHAEPPLEPTTGRLLFSSQGRMGLVRTDGSKPIYFEFNVPGQASWQPGPIFPDGRRLVLLSMEPRRDGPGRPFEEFYTQTPTHLWIYDLTTGSLKEIAQKDRLAPFMTPSLLVGSSQLLVQVVRQKVGQVFRIDLDGSQPVPFTQPGEGLPYGFSLSPDGNRVAFHLASPAGYQVWTSNTQGTERVHLAGEEGHLFFGTDWSPDGQTIVFVDCLPADDPGHDWGDVVIAGANGRPPQHLTRDRSMWFAATYGSPATRGGGSNIPTWTRSGKILYPKRLPQSKVPWAYRVGQPDLDHFNRDYKPQEAKGGSSIVRIDPRTGDEEWLTPPTEGVWDFRAAESPDGSAIAFCRAKVGQPPTLWVMLADGTQARPLTQGVEDRGADHPRWLPSPTPVPPVHDIR